jgi:LmbE family N-acetylglucosaminyl deacetylase
MAALRLAASKIPRVDAIGGSSAGVYVNNRPMAASLFRGIPRERFDEVKNMFLQIRDEMGVPLEVVNDGEVTALAGSMALEDNGILGIAQGSSEAAGYVTLRGNITGWLNELAFAPVDYNPDAPIDEWSGDQGCGALHLSQQCVFRLAAKIEIMACDGILQCFQRDDLWFCGVVVTNGSGSPRDGLYKDYIVEEMRVVRRKEQKKAAVVGEYGALALLDYPSSAVKDNSNKSPVEDLMAVLKTARPEVVYTHNLADKHDTHVAVALRVIEAIRALPASERPQRLYGCEIWRDLDWMVDADKVAFDCSAHENLQAALLGVFDSQICGGKRYDLATMGRRRANATYCASHDVDVATGITFAMDLTPLIRDPAKAIQAYVQEFIERFMQEVMERLGRPQ